MPLWTQLLDALTSRLQAGEFGSAFPSEKLISAEYGVSRHTVRQALRGLRESGVVTAARGRASRVSSDFPVDQPLGALYSLFHSVEQSGREQKSVVRMLDERQDEGMQLELGLGRGDRVIFLERLRLADDEPLALDRVWLPAEFAQPLLGADFSHTSLYEQLLSVCRIRITKGSETIAAVALDGEDLALLGSPESPIAFRIDRVGIAGKTLIERRSTLIRADKFTFSARWSPRSNYQFDVHSPSSPITQTHAGLSTSRSWPSC